MALRMMRSRSWRKVGRTAGEDASIKKQLQNAQEILLELNLKATSAAKRLALLNNLVKLINLSPRDGLVGFTTEEVLYCLRTSMVHEFTQVRAGVLRVIRHLLKVPRDLQVFNELQLTQLLCRSLDVLLDNEEERIQALKLIRKMLSLSPEIISPMIVRSLVSLGESGIEDGDRMLRACLATLCEFGVLNPILLIVCGGVSAITRNVLECHNPRMAESLCGVLLHLLEWPQTRCIAGVRLDCLAAPYCDFTYRLGIMDKNKHARDLRFTCSRLALLSVLRSWAGTLEFCDPNKPSGLKAIVDVLYLNQLEVRKAILDLLYELLWLPQPIWTDEYSVAIAAVDPADYQDAWRLAEGFVAMEGKYVLPSLANRVPNIVEIHTSLLLYCFLETGLLNALVEVIVSSAAFISVRATVLIGKLLQLMHTHLPADICNTSSALPTLISYAAQGNHQASAAISALQSLHQVFKNRPASCSLFLDSIIQSGAIVNSDIFKREIESSDATASSLPFFGASERSRHDSVGSSTSNSGDEPNLSNVSGISTLGRVSLKRKKFLHLFDSYRQSEHLMKESNVFGNDDGKTWDWEIITTILTRTNTSNKMDIKYIRFLRRLVHFFKPSSNRFSHQDLGHTRHIPAYVMTGMKLIDWLLESAEMESIRLLTDYFTDIATQLQAISTAKSAHDCLFSPQHMNSTMCQKYFLFIGRMCRSKIGVNILINTHIFKHLTNIVTTTIHICYIKLIVSGLDYSVDTLSRQVLEKALAASERSAGRMYATQFMLVLLRARIPNFEVWGLPLLIKQTKDKERMVVLAALEILDEACHDRTYLEELISIWPDFTPLGDPGRLLMTRYYSLPRGLNHTRARIQHEIEHWLNGFIRRYVLLIEADTHANLTLHTKSDDGTYSRRACSTQRTNTPPNMLPHLYGQLVQTTQGLENLLKFGNLPKLFEILSHAKCSDENETLTLKSAMWALGHMSTSKEGVELLSDPACHVYEKIIFLAKHCDVYSVRATALHVLGLVGCTQTGANVLFKFDWLCVRHNRDTLWPVCESEDWLSKHLTPIRHHIDKVPPYNYTGLDENINGMFGTLDESSSFYMPDSGETSKEDDASEVDGPVITASSKSRTLPENANKLAVLKHKRSLSESKTTDGISVTSSANPYVSRTRFNSGTDSNTSGVSSYESVFGIVMSDLCKTLSPIPSSSNLLEVKKPIERFRRISLTGASFRESTISPQDAQGYAKLRSIRRYQRPMLSESAADELAEIINTDSRSSNKLNIGQQQRRLKVRSLDRHSNLVPMDIDSSHEISHSMSGEATIPYSSAVSFMRGPCYSGVCMPKNILDLFPVKSSNGTYVTRCLQQDVDPMDLSSTMKPFMNDFISECDESSVSSLSDISSTSRRSKLAGNKHNRNQCLLCCRAALSTSVPSTKDYRLNNVSRCSSSIGAAMGGNVSDEVDGTSHLSAITPHRRRHTRTNTMIPATSDISFTSPDSLLCEDPCTDKIQSQVLRHVQRMANPIWTKQSKLALFKMKQKHYASFQDVCLYSEVCKALGRNTYRLPARRFLQELFLDVDYTSFYNDALDIINNKDDLSTGSPNNGSITSSQDVVDGDITMCVTLTDCIPPPTATTTTTTCVTSTAADKMRTFNCVTTAVPVPPVVTYSIKTHLLKSPPLASVHETSRENLSESLGTNPSKSANSSVTISNGCGANLIDTKAIIEFMPTITSRVTEAPTDNALSAFAAATNEFKSTNAPFNQRRYSRPRFNTLELDLSCTKNKFPITERRKTFDLSSSISNSALFSQRITKSLSSSITTPTTTSLFCEKRLQTSKSEAILSNNMCNSTAVYSHDPQPFNTMKTSISPTVSLTNCVGSKATSNPMQENSIK